MKIKVKQTGVEMEIPDGSPTAKRVLEQPDDYDILKDVILETVAEKPKKVPK